MTTFPTLEAARESLTIDMVDGWPMPKADGKHIRSILEIETKDGQSVFIRSLATADALQHAMRQTGNDMGIRRIIAEHKPVPDPDAYRDPAEVAYAAVERADDAVEEARDAREYDPQRIAQLEAAAAAVRQDWERRFPAAAQTNKERAAAAQRRRDDEIKRLPGYKAALEGRD